MSTNRTAKGGWCDPAKLPRGPNGRALCRRCGQEVPKGRQSFCGANCVHEWKLRTDPGYARDKVWARDHGRCALCPATVEKRGGHWEMDHIVPVVEGGGECGMDGLRSLCVPCHRRVTAELKGRLAARRAATKAETLGPLFSQEER